MEGLELWQAFSKLYEEFPEYIKREESTRKKLMITASDVLSEIDVHKITPADIAKYYSTQATNISSGMRLLGDMSGDWRQIDHLANECLEIFKLTCPNVVRKEAKALGLTPKF